MDRRKFLRRSLASLASLPAALAFQSEKSKLKITGVRLVRRRRTKPQEPYNPPPPPAGIVDIPEDAAAGPMTVYPEYRERRSSYRFDTGPVIGGFTVEIATDKGVKGYGTGGSAGGVIVENHLAKLLLNEDPFNVERLWDIMWRATMHYGQKGVTMNAISGVDLALWDLIGNATGLPAYKLLGGEVRPRIPCYATGNDIEVFANMGFKKIKIALPHGYGEGREGMKKNVELAKRARQALGPEGDIMLDCWMAMTESYTIEMVEMMAPYRVYWVEEFLPPYDYAGYARVKAKLSPILIVAGEHEYGRYGFRNLMEHNSADVWNPDVHWTGGFTETRRIAAMASAYDISVVPHGGGARDSIHLSMATPNTPLAEMWMPNPTKQYEEENQITRGPEGIYTRASDKPGMGWDMVVA